MFSIFYVFAYCVILYAFLSSADFFQKNYFENNIRVSNSLDTDQAPKR